MNHRHPRPEVSELITSRLSLYLRCLDHLEREGIPTTSSQRLGEELGLGSAQIRKDLATFGEFGVRGVGYSVPTLKKRLIRILGLERKLNVVILGAGNLGLALADYGGFNRDGFRVVALFDIARAKIGRASRGGVPILSISKLRQFARREKVRIAVVAVPEIAAQAVVDAAEKAGIPAILNFAPAQIRVPAHVELTTVDLKIRLQGLAFRLKKALRSGPPRPRSPGPAR